MRMIITARTLQILVRVLGALQIALGLLFWSGNLTELIPLHMLNGLILVLLLWTLAILGIFAGVPARLTVFALVWGLVTPVLGMAQDRLLLNSAHWLIQVLHLLVGIVLIGMADGIARRIRERPSRRRAGQAASVSGQVG